MAPILVVRSLGDVVCISPGAREKQRARNLRWRPDGVAACLDHSAAGEVDAQLKGKVRVLLLPDREMREILHAKSFGFLRACLYIESTHITATALWTVRTSH